MGYKIVQLKDVDDDDLEKIFKTFSSVNEDVEGFLKYKSIQFEKMDLKKFLNIKRQIINACM